jgi:RimJ/RimL family protein N-acetyltransferase
MSGAMIREQRTIRDRTRWVYFQVVDGNGSLAVYLDDERYCGTVVYDKRKGGWITQGCVMGPLAEQKDSAQEAAETLIAWITKPVKLDATDSDWKLGYWREQPGDDQ